MTGRSVDKSVDSTGQKAGRAPVVAALDLGQSKVACFIMKADGVRHADRTIRVAGAGHVQSRGVRGGGIVNMDEAAQAIGHAVERAERAAGSPVSGVVVTTAIGQMASHRVQARVSLGATPVGDADLARAIGMALAQIRLPNRRPIHVLPIAWSVDGARGVHDPRSMKGHSLGLDLLVVSMAESAFNGLSHCLELAHLDLQGVAAAPVVSMCIPSLLDDTLAPAGKHVMSLFCQHFNPNLPNGQDWDTCREMVADQIIAQVARYAPNLSDSIVGRQILSPLDLERDFALLGGDIFHGSLHLDQLYSLRPLPGYADYRMPLKGLYLCGSGAHPGGGVSGIPGRNAAAAIIRDSKRRWR